MGGITHAPNVQVQTGRLAWNKQIIAQFRAALVIAPIADPNDAMPFGFLLRWSEEMQVGGLMPDKGSTVPSRLDRKSVVSGKSESVRVNLGVRRLLKKKKK